MCFLLPESVAQRAKSVLDPAVIWHYIVSDHQLFEIPRKHFFKHITGKAGVSGELTTPSHKQLAPQQESVYPVLLK
ncbi:hypothetical protein Vi05172_g10999 [Venturia inaequalis]|nr:hypothetical protein Vi05172_g10999 [Venturia inaequalis]